MTGLEKIIGQIKGESDAAAAQVLSKAHAEADKILGEAKAEAERECVKIEHDSAAAVADRLARAKSAADLQKRKTILAKKQSLIGEVIDKAKQSLETLPDEEYFDFILKLAAQSAWAEEGKILFSQKDLGRMPAGFEEKLAGAAAAKGGKLTVSKETRTIGGGFVLVYGGVEENCSLTALVESARENLQDKVQELLFS